jgi:hypothetical protein
MRASLALVAVVALAIAGGWWLLRPQPLARSNAVPSGAVPYPTQSALVAAPTPTPVAEPTSLTTAATEAPALVTPVTALPSSSPLPSVSPLPSLTPNPNGVKLALIVDDCGQWIQTERAFIALGIPLTLSVLPDVHYTSEVAREASNAGKGVMLHLPMETLSGVNPGPGEVTTAMSNPQIVAQVQADLDQVPLARGVNNHEGSKASADERVMRAVIGVLAQHRDLFFIDSRTNKASVGEQTAEALGVPTARRDVFLDNRADVAYSEAQLLQAAEIARRNGSAIAIGHPRPTTLTAIQAMIPRLEASGIQFVLAQDLVTSDGQ